MLGGQDAVVSSPPDCAVVEQEEEVRVGLIFSTADRPYEGRDHRASLETVCRAEGTG